MQTNLQKPNTFKWSWQDLLPKIPIILLIIIAALIALQLYFFIYDKAIVEENAKSHAQVEVNRVIGELDVKFKSLMSIAQNFADELSAGKISNAELPDRLKQIVKENPQIYNFGVAYEPFAYDPSVKKFGLWYLWKDGTIDVLKSDEAEGPGDYYKQDWYKIEMDKGPIWVDPYYVTEINKSVIEFGIPFYRTDTTGKKIKVGLVNICCSVENMNQIMNSLDLGKHGYGYIISKTGKYVAHPIDSYINGGKSIFDIAKDLGNDGLSQAGKSITSTENGIKEFKNELNGQDSWLIYKTIPSTGWSLVVNFIKDQSSANITHQRRQLMRLSLAITLFLILLVIMICSKIQRKNKWWLAVLCSSVTLILCLGSIWNFTLNYTSHIDEKQDIIIDKAGLNQFKNNEQELAKTIHAEPPVFVPTGVFVNSLELLNANDVRLNGYIWQKYYSGVHDGLQHSFMLPGMISGTISEINKSKKDGVETIRWSFNVVLRQHFDYTRYPLESSGIYLKLLHNDFDKNIILVPDLDSYSITNPTSLPGVARERALPGWNISSSYFTYAKDDYGTNMGTIGSLAQSDLSSLCFTIIANKEFIAPFITDLLPIFVILFALFAVLLMVTKDEKKASIFGLKASGVIATSSGLLFSVIISHTRLRNELPVKEIIYLENFYLLLYFVIILVAINSFMFSAYDGTKGIYYKDNLLPKLFYWPVIFIILICITLRIFY